MSDLGSLLRSVREHAGWSLNDLAAHSHFTKAHLSNIENGRRTATAEVVLAYEAALGVRILSPAVEFRRLLSGVDDVVAPDRIGMSDVLAIEHGTQAITALDLDCGGGLAAEMAKGQLRWAIGLLGAEMREPVRRRLSSAVGNLAGRASYAMYDTGDSSSASRLSTLALRVADGADDPDLRAQLLMDVASQEIDGGNPGGALRTVDISDAGLSPVTRFVLHGIRARAHGALGDTRAAWRHVGLAEQCHAAVDPQALPQTFMPFAEGHAAHGDRDTGTALYELASHGSRKARSEAVDRLSKAVTSFGTGRKRAVVRSHVRLALMLAQDGQLDEARQHARAAVRDGDGLRSARVAADLTQLRQAAARW